MRSKISCRPSLRRPLTVSAFSNALEFRKSSALMQNFICLTVAVVDEILPLAASRARYLLATHACHSPYPLAASRRFTNVHRCRLSPASSRIFLCLVSRTSAASASRSRRAFKARKSILHKISLLRRARRLPHFAASPAANCRRAVSLARTL